MTRLLGVVAAWAVVLLASQAAAGTIYVDNLRGSDALNGRTQLVTNETNGPVRSLRRGVRLAIAGDAIVLANNARPYYDSVSLVGDRHSGSAPLPFRIIGNGAIISGARLVPAGGWTETAVGVWKMTPVRKGHYQLILDDEALPSIECPRETVLPSIPDGHWCAWRGAIYYRPAEQADPRFQDVMYGGGEVGLTLLGVRFVEIREIRFRHYRLDGVNLHDRCQNVLLDAVTCDQNGRAGVAVAGSSRAVLRRCRLADNREHSLLITELGESLVEESDLNPSPTVVE